MLPEEPSCRGVLAPTWPTLQSHVPTQPGHPGVHRLQTPHTCLPTRTMEKGGPATVGQQEVKPSCASPPPCPGSCPLSLGSWDWQSGSREGLS